MENAFPPGNVCSIMNVPLTAMSIFASTLNEDLGENFRSVVFALMFLLRDLRY
jgi:hypothetical protein